ncbi:hypothetical protein A5707_17250 [Mycobacterium kyorinense]|uniref:SIR2-like domain-containing protein n=1 Tax=Mycobacterium kyorinense TaxID=487514 RepID=A0A1A2ZIF5_9MYCO|nr:hypothetical protein [Mycobacterium kyorinense]OBI49262.1 hypothetical protein A5707_17250 [Mycobacterium kyorinense]
MRRVYLLGAGFSKAVSGEMPSMPELSAGVKSIISAAGGPDIPGVSTPIANDFEQWLSYLVEAPPWLTEAEQSRNKASFWEVSRAVHEVLWVAEMRALTGSDCPPWLQQLVKYWHDESAKVISFNYDMLVELAWLVYASGGTARNLYPAPVTPISTRRAAVLGGRRPSEGLELMKLHGSLSWRYSGPESPPGDTIYDVDIAGGSWDATGILPRNDDAEYLSVDREPMIVPPAAVKSPYYNNRTLQALWRSAAEALADAEELVIMGFSLPQSDQLVRAMLCTNLPDSAGIVPVDYENDVLSRVRDTFGLNDSDPRVVDVFTGLGADAIPRWVSEFANIS